MERCWDFLPIGLLLSCTIWTCGCARDIPFSRDPKIAASQVSELVPKGASEERAKFVLHERGFEMSRLSSDHAPNHLLIGTCTKADITWQIGLVIIDHKVAASSVTVLKANTAPR